ncbi:nitrogenase cofactor biosynthesis protein NifB [Ectothiorhodospira mobilis]|uniref:nitrogenase cofactor biosynthesis protein NifB n=1 Tax=Ectothiorhodospira mobilis TaxID=195064 RepID=UPI001908E376|nr:nitrogenase cofactor biosynthesis protein NifB [Ectothiorhodospira mobilis]MBK1690595.1 nitrogenase cofactor biosynthesis protein NifB [Ectothiorhodospira mobilis]
MAPQRKRLGNIPVIPLDGAPSGPGGGADLLPEAVQRRVQDHPCYSEQAHHHFARMHVAVAPACNIQCHYCNRKYDCANESRPGVVSRRLTPDEAIDQVLWVAEQVPELSVVGIAGPGDALAHPERTFQTLEGIRRHAPDLKLCLSTNGLALPEHAQALADLGVEHVTVTVNAVDPGVGARIHPWVRWQGRRLHGEAAAERLIRQQQEGIRRLVERGALVKVNSVLIPGINDRHLREVARVLRGQGVFLHNIMPLIARAEHGTRFGLDGQREPTPAELAAVREACGGEVRMMRHCRQCRADAVGRLGEDLGPRFQRESPPAAVRERAGEAGRRRQAAHAAILQSMAARPSPSPAVEGSRRPVLMAVATRGGGLINEHFGHAREFLIYRASPEGVRFEGHRRADLYCSGPQDCGDGESVLQSTLRALEDCEALLCARVGIGPWRALEAAGILPHVEHAMAPIEEGVLAVYEAMAEAGCLDAVSSPEGLLAAVS